MGYCHGFCRRACCSPYDETLVMIGLSYGIDAIRMFGYLCKVRRSAVGSAPWALFPGGGPHHLGIAIGPLPVSSLARTGSALGMVFPEEPDPFPD